MTKTLALAVVVGVLDDDGPGLDPATVEGREGKIMRSHVAALDGTRRLCIRYEDLAAEYAGASKQIFAWLGLDYASEVAHFVSRYKDVDAHATRAARLIHKDFLSTSVGRWKREISAADRRSAADLAGDFMDRYGYER